MNSTMRTRWATQPHIRFGDPCYDCGRPMTPASREWSRDTIPPGHVKHAGHALCSTCRQRRAATGTLEEALSKEVEQCPSR